MPNQTENGAAGRSVTTVGAAPLPSPVPRGRLLFVEDVRGEVFNDRVTSWWVRRNVAPAAKIRLGHSTVAWYEEDVWAWVNGRKGT
jgi:hypothetical protein